MGKQAFAGHRNETIYVISKDPQNPLKTQQNSNAGKLEKSNAEKVLKSLEIQAFRGHRNGSDFFGQKPFKNIAKTHVSCLAQGEAGSHLRETMEN